MCIHTKQTPRVSPQEHTRTPAQTTLHTLTGLHLQGHPRCAEAAALQGSAGRLGTWSQNSPRSANTKTITIFNGKSKHKDDSKTKLNCVKIRKCTILVLTTESIHTSPRSLKSSKYRDFCFLLFDLKILANLYQLKIFTIRVTYIFSTIKVGQT